MTKNQPTLHEPAVQATSMQRRALELAFEIVHDARVALRQLVARPVLSLVAILTLALAIGANTAIFSVVHGVLFSPLPFADAEQLVLLGESHGGRSVQVASSPNFRDWRESNETFVDMAAIRRTGFNSSGEGDPVRLAGAKVSAGFFALLGVEPAAGRFFLPEDDVAGAAPVAILSHEAWTRRYGADRSLIGGSLDLDGTPTTIVGVAPRGISFPSGAEIWTPQAFDWQRETRDNSYLLVLARMRSGISESLAQADLDRIAAALAAEYPQSNSGSGISIQPLREVLVGDIRPMLLALFATVAMVLLIACANVANLSLTQLSFRTREVAIRQALGAGRGRVLRQLLTESLLLAFLGAALGVLLASWGTELLVGRFADLLPRTDSVTIDRTVLLFTLGVTVVTGLVFGLAPALRASTVHLVESLKEGARNALGGRGLSRLRRVLVLVEVSVAMVLLVGAGLMIRSFDRLLDTDPGFDPVGKLALELDLPANAYGDPGRHEVFVERSLEAVRSRPGVRDAAYVFPLPLSGSGFGLSFLFEEQGVPESYSGWPLAGLRMVTDGYFDVMGIPLRAGQSFEEIGTRADGRTVVLVNEAFAARWEEFSGGPGAAGMVGRTITFGDPGDDEPDEWFEIAGIVGDVRFDELSRAPQPEIFMPMSQAQLLGLPTRGLTLVADVDLPDAADALPSIRSAVAGVDPALPLYQFRTLEQLVTDSVAGPNMAATLLSLFSVLAWALAVVGVYGVLSFAIAQRMPELGLRLALGASRGTLLRMVARQGLRPVVHGLGLGLLGAAAFGTWLGSQLHGVGPFDLPTYAAVAVLLLVSAALAVLIPARRATSLDPASVLKNE